MSNMILTQTNGNLLNNNNNNNNNTTGTGTTTTTTSLPPIISTNSTTTPTLSPSTTNYNNNNNNSINSTSTPTTIISTTSNNSNNHNNLNSNTNNQLTATLQLNHLITPTTATLAALPSHYHSTYKDTRWLTLEVCREYQRNKCNRSENECKFAHPPPHVEVTNGKVIACYDSLKSKCTRKEPPCKYLHPPQHLKDQLLQNGKNNLVLKQVAIAMMQQQHQQQQQQQQHIHTIHHPSAAAHVNTQAILAAAGQTQFAPYHTTHNPNQAIYNAIPASALANGAITGFQQVTSPNGQTTLVPIVATNGFHTAGLQMTPGAIYADPTLLQHVATATQPNPNGLLPPHQRTDRLTQYSQQLNATAFIANQNHDETATLNGTQTTYQIDNNGTTYTTYPQFQIITPIYQQQQLKTTSNNTNNNVSTNNSTSNNNNNGNNNNNNNNGNNNSNNNTTVLNSNDDAAASSSATANATANLGDVIVTTSKKRSHDATEDFLQLQQAQHIYGTQLPIKRTALADTKTGLPVYQPYTTSHHPHANTAHQIHAVNALQLQQAQQHIATIPTQFGANLAAHQQTTFPQFTMQYAYPGATATYSIPYTGNPTSVPRL